MGEPFDKSGVDLVSLLFAQMDSQRGFEAIGREALGTLASLYDANAACYFKSSPFLNAPDILITYERPQSEDNGTQQFVQSWDKCIGVGQEACAKTGLVISETSFKYSKHSFSPFDKKYWRTEIAFPIFSGVPESKLAIGGVIMQRIARERMQQEERSILDLVFRGISLNRGNRAIEKELRAEIEFRDSVARVNAESIDEMIGSHLQELSELMPTKFASLWLYNELGQTLVLRNFFPSVVSNKGVTLDSFDSRVLDCLRDPTGGPVSTGKPQVFKDVQSLQSFSNKTFAKRYGLSAMACFPIMSAGQIVGVVEIYPQNASDLLDEKSLPNLSSFVSRIGASIRLENLLFEDSLLTDLDEFLTIMLQFHDERLGWDRLASLVRDKMRCEACSIFLAEDDGTLQLKGSTGLDPDIPYAEARYLPDEPALTTKAFKQGQPLLYYSELKEKFFDVHHSKIREKLRSPGRSKSIILVNILDELGKPIGVIRCNNKETTPARHIGRFTKEDVLRLKRVARVISNIHVHMSSLRSKEWDRERNLNSLHHEILGPVEGILSHIEWLEKNLYSSDSETIQKVRLKFEDIKQNGKLMDILATTMGSYDNHVQLSISDFNVTATLQQCKAFLHNEARVRNVEIRIGYLGIPKVKADTFHMMRVFYNLMRNALKYYDRKEAERYLAISAEAGNGEVKILFSDNGIGVLPGEEDRIFEKFERGSNASKVFPQGTGLGLAFCKTIMADHGGIIRIANLSKPTIFELAIPIR